MMDLMPSTQASLVKKEELEEPMTSAFVTTGQEGAAYNARLPPAYPSDSPGETSLLPHTADPTRTLSDDGVRSSDKAGGHIEAGAVLCGPLEQTTGAAADERGEGPIRREQQKRRSKPKEKGSNYVCGVCSDRALGYNFDAITCESCKAFFRRNAVKKKELVCSFDGSCTIDPHSRKFCPACRLKKCFDIGMKREWILTDDQLQKRRVKAHVRRIGLASQPYPPPASGEMPRSSSPVSTGLSPGPSSFSAPLSHAASTLGSVSLPLHVQPQNTKARGVAVYSPDLSTSSEQDFFSPNSSGDRKRVYSEGYSSEGTSALHPVDLSSFSQSMPNLMNAGDGSLRDCSASLYTSPSTDSSGLSGDSHPLSQHLHQGPKETAVRPLNLEEHANLGSILKSYKLVFESPIPDQFTETFQFVNALADIWNLTDCFIRRLIKFSKQFDEFRLLKQEDQIALLKGGVMELMSLRSIFTFHPEQGDFILTSSKLGPNSISVDIRKAQAQIPEQMFEHMTEHFQFVQQAMALTNEDHLTLILLMVIELFSCDRPNLGDREAVSKAQERYSSLLRHYLENRFGYKEAIRMFPKLLSLLLQVRDRGRIGSWMLGNCDSRLLRPLVCEMITPFMEGESQDLTNNGQESQTLPNSQAL